MTLKAFAYLKPDIILLGICENDLYDLCFNKWVMVKGDIIKFISPLRHINYYNQLMFGTENKSRRNFLKEFGRNHLFLYNYLGYLKGKKGVGLTKKYSRYSIKRDARTGKTQKVLSLFKELCGEMGAEFAVFFVKEKDTPAHRYLEEQVSDLGITVFDISETNPTYYPNDGHLTPEGTMCVVNKLAERL